MWGEQEEGGAGQVAVVWSGCALVAVVEWVCAGGSHPDAKDVGSGMGVAG